MVSRWASRRRWLQNSPEVSTSTARVLTAMATFSPPDTVRVACLLAFSAFLKKYSALFLWSVSRIVPPATRMTMAMT